MRVAGTSEKPLFCLADICRVLEIRNVSDCKSRLDQKGIVLTDTPTNGGIQQLVFINEKNLYKVIMRSDKPQAEPFQDWVCGEVLPSIRKTGSYSVQPKTPKTYLEALEALVESEKEKQRIELENRKQQLLIEKKDEQISSLKDENAQLMKESEYARIILQSKSTVLVTQIAQDYGMSAVKFNAMLRDLGIQRKVRRQWILTAKYINHGYVQSSTHNFTHTNGVPDVSLTTEWTQRGRLFLYVFLKKQGILLLIETVAS